MGQDASAPAVLNRGVEVPKASGRVFGPVQKEHMVTHGNSAATCCTIGSSGQASAKGPHVLERTEAKAIDPRKLVLRVVS
jgi:hypothetical protein